MIRSLFGLTCSLEYETWRTDKVAAPWTNRDMLESWEAFWRGYACGDSVLVSVYSHVLHEIGKTREIYERVISLNDPRS